MIGVYLLISTTLIANGLAALTCQGGMKLYEQESKCLELVLGKYDAVTLDQAKITCQAWGGQVVQIKTIYKDRFINSLMPPTEEDQLLSWNGAEDPDNDQQFHFLDGTPVSSYKPWVDRPRSQDNCVLRAKSDHNSDVVYWHAIPCDVTGAVVCEKDAEEISTEPCGRKWLHNTKDGVCIKVVKGKKKTFSDARKYCQYLGGDLATSIASKWERSFVMSTIKFKAHFWIGVQDLDRDGVPTYVDGLPLGADQPFKAGRQISHDNQHYCFSIKKRNWYGKRCSKKQFFICEKKL